MDVLTSQPAVQPVRSRFGDLAKRLFDIVAASLGLIVLAPFFVLIGILIKRDSEGPVIYKGSRIGKNGEPFWIYKFRTMYEDPASYEGPRITSSDDSRITPLGKWLRNTKINELPQLWNVLLGNMTLVGPRPEDPDIIDAYPSDVREEILSVRPGVTSPASVLYHSEQDLLSSEDAMGTYLKQILPDKLQLDQLYVRNRSFASDLDIVFWTLAIFIPRISRTRIPEGYLFAGPFSRFIYRHFSWFLADMLVTLAAVTVATIAWRTQEPLNWGWDSLLALSFCFAMAFSAVNYIAGLNRIVWSIATGEESFGVHFSAGGVTLAALFLNYLQARYHLLPVPALPTVLILSIGLLAHFGFLAVRYRLRLLSWILESLSTLHRNAPTTGERILILGEGENCHIASWLLRRGMFRPAFSIVGLVANEDPTKEGMRVNGCRVLGGIRDLQALIKRYRAKAVLYALSNEDRHTRESVFSLCRDAGVKLVFLNDLMDYVSQQGARPARSREYLEWLQKRADFSTTRDVLTGLPNGALLQERLRHSLAYSRRYKTSAALIAIDLNGFPNGNGNSHTYDRTSDEILKIVTKRLGEFKRESDTLARIDAHRLAMVMENIPDRDAAELILRRTKSLLAKPLSLGNGEFSIRADLELRFPANNLQELQMLLRLPQRDIAEEEGAVGAGPKVASMVVAGLRTGDVRREPGRAEEESDSGAVSGSKSAVI